MKLSVLLDQTFFFVPSLLTISIVIATVVRQIYFLFGAIMDWFRTTFEDYHDEEKKTCQPPSGFSSF